MEVKKSIIIAEDATIVREGLNLILSANPDYIIAAEATNGREAVLLARKHKPDLILMDLSMPLMNGMAAIAEIKKENPQVRILVLTVHKSDEFIAAALEAGADGYILKDAGRPELMLAVKAVLEGKNYISPGITETLIYGYLGSQTARPRTLAATLTQREREILKLIAEGLKSREIGDLLCISVKTVEKHRENIMQKLNIHNLPALTSFAITNGLAVHGR
ncbi:MAG: response regulator transcription factor [Pseudomonadota bacterium]